MRFLGIIGLAAAFLAVGCSPSAPTLEGTWSDAEDRVFVEFNKNEIYLGERNLNLRLLCGSYQYKNEDSIEITFNEVGLRARKFGKDPKKGVTILHDTFASIEEDEKFKDVVLIGVKLKDNTLVMQAAGKPPVTWKVGKPYKQ